MPLENFLPLLTIKTSVFLVFRGLWTKNNPYSDQFLNTNHKNTILLKFKITF